MSDENLAPSEPAFKDCKTGLVLFGALQIGLGSLCALMIPLMLIGLLASKALDNKAAPPMDTHVILPAILIYALIALWFIWLGTGSILARRWARALLLVSAWVWLISGVGGLTVMGLILPDMYAQMSANGQMPHAVARIVMWVTFGFMGVFYVLLPGGMALFYGSKNVKATCASRNPGPSWTDACPLPVLALSLLFFLWSCSLVFMGFYGWVLPFFGFLLSGAPGAAVALATAAFLAYIAWGTYRLEPRAWTCSVGLVSAWALSAGLTFSRFSLMDFYAKMNFPAQQLELMKPICNTHGPLIAWFCALWLAALLGYLLYARKYFSKPRSKPLRQE